MQQITVFIDLQDQLNMFRTKLLVRCQLNLTLIDRFLNNTKISNLMKICPVGAELFHADGQTEGRTSRN
jgi:hypothetical protein